MSVPTHDPDLDLLSPPEAAQILKIPTARTMERWRSEGTGPDFVKVGRRVAYTRGAIKRFIQLKTRNSTSDKG